MTGVNKVEIVTSDGTAETLIDLTSDTVTSDTLAEGFVAHSSDGNVIIGRMSPNSSGGTSYTDEEIATIARTLLNEEEDELNIVAGQTWGDGAWLALRKRWRADRGGSFELFAFGETGVEWTSLYGDSDGRLEWCDNQIAMLIDIPTDQHINDLIDAKLEAIENGSY